MNINSTSTPRLLSKESLPPQLAKRAADLRQNPDVYEFPSRLETYTGSADHINFDKAWSVISNPLHWEDDSYHNALDHQTPGQEQSHEGAWFKMSHNGAPLMPTVLKPQEFAGVIVESKVDGELGSRVGKVVLAELNLSGKEGFKAIPEHLQTMTLTEGEAGEVSVKLEVATAPSDSPQWLRKGFLVPWATWHIELDEADKMRHIEHRLFPAQPLKPNRLKRNTLLGAVGGGLLAACASGGNLAGGLAGALLGGGLAYYATGEQLKS